MSGRPGLNPVVVGPWEHLIYGLLIFFVLFHVRISGLAEKLEQELRIVAVERTNKALIIDIKPPGS